MELDWLRMFWQRILAVSQNNNYSKKTSLSQKSALPPSPKSQDRPSSAAASDAQIPLSAKKIYTTRNLKYSVMIGSHSSHSTEFLTPSLY
jgi:hypothetical protein